MKRFFIFGVLFFLLLTSASAQTNSMSFVDAIQDLAMQTACIGQYSATQAGGGWYDDPHDYYTPQMIAERLAKMSGNMTRSTTFYGVCFDYAQFAYQDIEQYKSWYNDNGMYERQFWIAGVHGDSNKIQLQYPGTKDSYTTVQNGVYVKIPNTKGRNVKTHRLNNQGERATNHAWLWIERADGVWFWIDPTWTDNLGYIVYGYVRNGEEIQCRPDKEFCIEYPAYLNNLPSPPAMGQRKAPSKTANSTNREETINDAAIQWELGDFSNPKNWVAHGGLMISLTNPVSAFDSVSPDKMGFGIDLCTMLGRTSTIIGLEYLRNYSNDDDINGGIFSLSVGRRIFENFAYFIGGGGGLYIDSEHDTSAAYKVDSGFLFITFPFSAKLQVSYDNVLGLSVGAGVGIGF